LLGSGPGLAEEVHVAVAANFVAPLEAIGEAFEAARGHRLLVSSGSTGKLYAQVVQGAPFEVFLAADAEHPARLEAAGLAVAGSRVTYARGRLALWAPGLDPGEAPASLEEALRAADLRHLALANPKTAPYGAATRQVLEHLGLWASLSPRLVRGESVGQAFQYVHTGNAEMGFVALSQLRDLGEEPRGSWWPVPESLHEPLEQQAVLLRPGESHPGARALLAFLRSPTARSVLARFGYGVDPGGE
jgi:molybdate transport system substrate-binding protein